MNFTSRNEVTGAWLKSKRTNDNYRSGFDAIFGKKEKPAEQQEAAVEKLAEKPDDKE